MISAGLIYRSCKTDRSQEIRSDWVSVWGYHLYNSTVLMVHPALSLSLQLPLSLQLAGSARSEVNTTPYKY